MRSLFGKWNLLKNLSTYGDNYVNLVEKSTARKPGNRAFENNVTNEDNINLIWKSYENQTSVIKIEIELMNSH